MCLGLPGQIISITGMTAVIDCWGTQKSVGFEESAEAFLPGDYVIEHEGKVVRRVSPAEVEDTLILYEAVLGESLVPGMGNES
ncbi:MAG: HypC/HybG/HupF family hydrogenase formation chaperone [Acidobacteriota bacterium]